MRAGGSKQKGASFERLVCKQLSLWMSHGQREDLYWRSSMSGGRATVSARKGLRLQAQAGDITAIDSSGEPLTRQFLLECKHYRNLQALGLVQNTGELSKFWTKLKADSLESDKLPLLIAKQNGYSALACVDRKGLDVLVLKFYCVLTAPKLNFYAVLFDQLLKTGKRPDGT